MSYGGAPNNHFARIDLRDTSTSLAQELHHLAMEDVQALEVFTARDGNLDGLQAVPNLRALRIFGKARFPKDATFPLLDSYVGPFDSAVLAAPRLRSLAPGESRVPDGEIEIHGPVERLVLMSRRVSSGGLVMSHPDCLSELVVGNYLEFSLAGAHLFENLARVQFHSIATLRAIDELVSLKKVEFISFEKILAVEPLQALELLRAKEMISVIDRHPFSRELRERLRSSATRWSFPTGERYYVSGAGSS